MLFAAFAFDSGYGQNNRATRSTTKSQGLVRTTLRTPVRQQVKQCSISNEKFLNIIEFSYQQDQLQHVHQVKPHQGDKTPQLLHHNPPEAFHNSRLSLQELLHQILSNQIPTLFPQYL